MQFPDRYPQHSHKDHSAYILTDAVFAGLGLVPFIMKTPHHEINPSGEDIYVEKVKSLNIFRALAKRLSQSSFCPR